MDFGIVTFLRLGWIAAILPIVVASVPIRSLDFFHMIIQGCASRGKVLPSSDRFTVPHRCFLHFYVVAVVLTTSLLLSTWFYAYGETEAMEPIEFSGSNSYILGGSHNDVHYAAYRAWRTVFVLILMEAQVLRRLYETECVFVYSPSARMHVLGYVTGLCFYTAAPVSLCGTFFLDALKYSFDQITELLVEGKTMLPFHFELLQIWKPLINLGWCPWVGAAIFAWGWLHQLRCHSILGSLHKGRGSSDYVIPHGDWFQYVSCPHYLAEIIIYAGILVATEGSDATVWLLFLFVVANLLFAAAEVHSWYRRKFDTYPKSRKAIIPLIF